MSATWALWPAIVEAFRTLLFDRDNDIIRAIGPAPMGGEFVEIVIEEGPLRKAMWRYSRNVLLISLLISAISAALVYFALHYLFVRPLRRITANMMAFRADPENPACASSPPAGAATRSASPSASSPACSATSPRCCSRRPGWRRSVLRCRRSIMICATFWPRRSFSPTAW